MTITDISPYQISARDFFTAIQERKADLVIDIRRNSQSQLAGFSKDDTLAYLVSLICKAHYVHDIRFAPDASLLKAYISKQITYEEYARGYIESLQAQDGKKMFFNSYGSYQSIVLIGAKTKQRKSHSEALRKYLEENNYEGK